MSDVPQTGTECYADEMVEDHCTELFSRVRIYANYWIFNFLPIGYLIFI